MVADSVELLLRYPPDFLAAQIHSWVVNQHLSAPVAEYLYHSARKLSLLGELDLIPRDVLKAALQLLVAPLVTYCPEADRDTLRGNLERLAAAAPVPTKVASGDQVLHRQETKPPVGAPPVPAAVPLSGDARRLTLLLDRLRPLANLAGPPEQRAEIASQFITVAAVGANT